ncbi:MAG: malate synthase A [Planctomycetes bacterium]|nr:malate synthase A [Planctomycetota bacterium]
MTGMLARGGLDVLAPIEPGFDEILTPEALAFLADLERRFGPIRRRLLDARVRRQRALDRGARPHFLPETKHIRDAGWRVRPVPSDLQDRRVEITGPVDRKMIINALNSGAKVFMADFEDSSSPTWSNMVGGQLHLRDAVDRTIEFTNEAGKQYRLNHEVATLMVRPRGWHLPEKNVRLDGKPISGSLFDFGLYFFHNARQLIENGTGPYFYLPKLESHLEARLWNEVFEYSQERLGIPVGTIKATVLIETITAAFEMEEILYELQDHSAGLNCGRWDYIFSFIKRLRADASFVLPDRALVTMSAHCMRSYSRLLIQTCHRRGAHAMGGMAAQIPIKNDPVAHETAMAKVLADKEREVADGHDGTWVAHPGLVAVARGVFDAHMKSPNQLQVIPDGEITEEDLLTVPEGAITEQGLRTNLEIGVRYLASWLCGNGCVPIHHLMEDAATAEISRVQVWQWIHHCASLEDGRRIDRALVFAILHEEMTRLRDEVGAEAFLSERFDEAASLFGRMVDAEELVEFLTLPAYERI